MTNAAKTITISMSDWPRGLFRTIKARAAEENVTLEQYVSAMFWHALKGHDLSKIHFYQDGSGQTYNLDVIEEIIKQSDAESAAGLTTVCYSKEELFAHLKNIGKVTEARGELIQHV